jgi:hypothetical protein
MTSSPGLGTGALFLPYTSCRYRAECLHSKRSAKANGPVILPLDAMPTRPAADNGSSRASPIEVGLGERGAAASFDRLTRCKPFRDPV